MPMREGCKYFQSRTYPNGDVVRSCDLDLAPEAPWRCPADCASYRPRLADVNWSHGSLVLPPPPPEPPGLGEGGTVAELLDEVEEIVNAAAERSREQLAQERARRASLRGRISSRFRRFGRGGR